MIADFLDRAFVLDQARAQRRSLEQLLKRADARDPKALAAMRGQKVSRSQIEKAIRALGLALSRQQGGKPQRRGAMREVEQAFIPSDPVLCNFQTGMTEAALRRRGVEPTAAAPSHERRRSVSAPSRTGRSPIDTSPGVQLKRQPKAATVATPRRGQRRAPFVEGDDIHYGLDGFFAKFGGLFKSKRKFNNKPAVPPVSDKPLRLFLFGDWGTGLFLAQKMTGEIRRQLEAADGTRQQHVVHLGDVYYVGKGSEYDAHVLSGDAWPVRSDQRGRIGSWSLNGNHDMYAGGGGYFDTLLREGRFAKWQSDPAGEPTSFFVIEDEHWQFFGLDSSWKTPSLASAVFGEPKLTDYGGQNGILTDAQAKWMARHRNPAKGCVLMTHHQPASSRTGENQHSDEAVKLLRQHGVYDQIDAWFWGHEHRCVVFKPKAERTSKVLADAPAFCACVGHGGVPVTQENFDTDKTIGDVQWQEGKIDSMSPIYGGERILPFGFARIDTSASALEICIFDHYGNERYRTTFERPVDSAPHAAMTRRSITPKKKGKKSAAQQGRR